jgi:pimeloyl-ACP methyl ester carboxylesterase
MVREQGMAAVASLSAQRFFAPDFVMVHPDIAERVTASVRHMAPSGYAGCAAAIRDMALGDRLSQIVVPVLIVAGREDVSTPYEGHASRILQAIPSAMLVQLPCGYLAPLEVPDKLAEIMQTFLMETKSG